jgi:hypothetical protein
MFADKLGQFARHRRDSPCRIGAPQETPALVAEGSVFGRLRNSRERLA